MADWYVDPAATGANDGTSWTDAWTSTQVALDTVSTGGDNIFARGTDVIGASLDCDAHNGGGGTPICLIGVNSSGVDDGTKFVIDATGAAKGLVNSKFSRMFKNLEIKNANGEGVENFSGTYNMYWNVYSHSNGGKGFDNNNTADTTFYKCKAENNTSYGFGGMNAGMTVFCSAIGNGSIGFEGFKGNGMAVGCISHDNTFDGFGTGAFTQSLFMHCVADDNGRDGIRRASVWAGLVLYNRCTNNTGYGLYINGAGKGIEDFNFMLGNTAGQYENESSMFSGGNSLTAGTIGYVDQANDDFNLTAAASLRRTNAEIGGDTP